MSAFMSDRTPEERRFMRLQLVVYDILRAEDGGLLATPPLVDDFVRAILALDPKSAESGEREGWVLAPREADEAMLLAPDDAGVGLYSREVFATIYRAMIAAAPKPPEKPRG